MIYKKEMTLEFDALSENESFARACVASFCLNLDPSLDEINDIKTAVSEAVTNCVVHAYPQGKGKVVINVRIEDKSIYIKIKDFGVGISNVEKAQQPFFTSKPSRERSGMGFTIMEGFMDDVRVHSVPNMGTEVEFVKKISGNDCILQGGESVTNFGYSRVNKASAGR